MRKLILLSLCIVVAGCGLYLATIDGRELESSDIARDEAIVFFRTSAWLDEAKGIWHVPIHGWIYEPEDSTVRKALIAELLKKQFDLAPDEATKANFTRRLNLLLADSERDKHIVVDIAGQQHTLSPSAENGHFESTLEIPAADIAPCFADSKISYSAISENSEARTFTGEVLFVEPNGLSVISDIDDTVKISHVTDRKKLLNHTFFLDFAAAPGMAQLYRDWADQGADFHFVSSSPWQLYAPLREFLDAAGFPRATLNLKPVRFRDETLLDLFKKGTETKPRVIEEILDAYPGRQFVLVGDSGEQDPEVYAAILQKHPEQVLKVYIRNVSSESASDDRFRSVFKDVDQDNWVLFDDPRTLSLP